MENPLSDYDVIILGGGAAGLMCAISAGQRGRRVVLLEHAGRIGKKILMSGGGRCNFTNLNTTPEHFISANPHFCKSALARYTPWDFVALVDSHDIPWHEKGPGQLFCDRSSKDIVSMLAAECSRARVQIRTQCEILGVEHADGYMVNTCLGSFRAPNLVIATGGLSIPRMGATGFGYTLAKQFGLDILPRRAGLVPLTLAGDDLAVWSQVSGVSLEVNAQTDAAAFRENLLFTHRGLSGPAILQLSSYWQAGEPVIIDLLPSQEARGWLDEQRRVRGRQTLGNALAQIMSKRVAELFCEHYLDAAIARSSVAELSRDQLQDVAGLLNAFTLYPNGTEGYRTAEVTLGGVATDALSSQTMQAQSVHGLYLIGEVVDVTGQLGGFNFQWAWASGWCAGQAV